MMAEREPSVVNALSLHQSEPEVAKVIVVRRCDRQLQLVHFALPHVGGKIYPIRHWKRSLHHSIPKFEAMAKIISRRRHRGRIGSLSRKRATVARLI
jgi:hypothetical protein